ncbi:MAG: hypothetical protein FWB74_06080 [Defluviitaleaceae bacterium]|nr:hypothetical protein [Defluviitaleaceae bacterium]
MSEQKSVIERFFRVTVSEQEKSDTRHFLRIIKYVFFSTLLGILIGLATTFLGQWINDGVHPDHRLLGYLSVLAFLFASIGSLGFAILNRKFSRILKIFDKVASQ